jgi:DNA-binding response OmpR family regulator
VLLSRSGFAVDVVSDATSAVERVGRVQYGAIITELVLSDLSGIDFIRRVVSSFPHYAGRIIVVTSWPRAAKSLRGGLVRTVMSKPFEIEELAAHVRETAAFIRMVPPLAGKEISG